MGLLLKRGADPYADAGIADVRTGLMPVRETVSAAATTQYASPVRGRIRRLSLTVVTVPTVAAGQVDVNLGGNTLGSISVPQTASIGDKYVVNIPDSDGGTDANFVEPGDLIEIDNDGGATADGILDGHLWISSHD